MNKFYHHTRSNNLSPHSLRLNMLKQRLSPQKTVVGRFRVSAERFKEIAETGVAFLLAADEKALNDFIE